MKIMRNVLVFLVVSVTLVSGVACNIPGFKGNDRTPAPTAVPTPVSTLVPTPVSTAAPTPASAAGPTPVSTATPTLMPTSTPTPISTSTPTPTPIPSAATGGTGAVSPAVLWWRQEWSADGGTLSVNYNQCQSNLSGTETIGKNYTSGGVLENSTDVELRHGTDVYGRAQNRTIATLSIWHGGSVKPDSETAEGTIVYPATADSLFTRSVSVNLTWEYDSNGRLWGGTGAEESSGHISTSGSGLTFSGSASGSFLIMSGKLACTQRVEQTDYYYEGKLYANVTTVITPQSQWFGGVLSIVRETCKTTTTYADGGQRESDIVVLWQRNENGSLTGKSGSGSVTGTEIINGRPVSYTGVITLSYDYNTQSGWHKTCL